MASERIAKIVKSLKNFARLDESEFQKADLHEGLDSTLTLLEHELKNRIEVNKHYGTIPELACYPNQLNQVFMNIMANAIQSIHEKGTITISTGTENGNIVIKIHDNGVGIDEKHIGQIFDPGFTTKGVGVGTGLGLSISYNIIKKHNGEIKVESELNKGTAFNIILPCARVYPLPVILALLYIQGVQKRRNFPGALPGNVCIFLFVIVLTRRKVYKITLNYPGPLHNFLISGMCGL